MVAVQEACQSLLQEMQQDFPHFTIRAKAEDPWLWTGLTWFGRVLPPYGVSGPDMMQNYTTTLHPPTLWVPTDGKSWQTSSAVNQELILLHEWTYLQEVRELGYVSRWGRIQHYGRLLWDRTYRQKLVLSGWDINLQTHLRKHQGKLPESLREKILAHWTGADYLYAFTKDEALDALGQIVLDWHLTAALADRVIDHLRQKNGMLYPEELAQSIGIQAIDLSASIEFLLQEDRIAVADDGLICQIENPIRS